MWTGGHSGAMPRQERRSAFDLTLTLFLTQPILVFFFYHYFFLWQPAVGIAVGAKGEVHSAKVKSKKGLPVERTKVIPQ